MRKPFVLLVVPFKGEAKLVLDFLYSLSNQYASGISYSVILWDDGSDDNELNYLYNAIQKTYGNKFTIIKHDHEGYTRTVYNITEFAKSQPDYDYLLLVNSDVKFNSGTIHALTKRMMLNPNTACVGGKILNMETTVINHTGTRLENGQVVNPYVGLDKNDPSTMHVERRLWVNGCCTLYNLRILRKENLNFNLEFTPAYFEEADLMTTLNQKGYSVLYEPRAEIEHLVNGTMGKEKSKYSEIFWNNWHKYLSKWLPYFDNKQLQF